MNHSSGAGRAKRSLDFTVAGLALLILSPVLVWTSIQVRRKLGAPVFFRQTRLGLRGKPFRMVKFRTMREAVDVQHQPLPDSERLTNFGRFLRRTSLDELPELWNVLRGDMSLVGPRPLLTQYLEHYTDAERVRFQVRPGITGWAQVNGRNTASWDQRLANDIWYVENQSLLLDVRILLMTIRNVFRGQDVVVDTRSTMLDLDQERMSRKDVNLQARENFTGTLKDESRL